MNNNVFNYCSTDQKETYPPIQLIKVIENLTCSRYYSQQQVPSVLLQNIHTLVSLSVYYCDFFEGWSLCLCVRGWTQSWFLFCTPVLVLCVLWFHEHQQRQKLFVSAASWILHRICCLFLSSLFYISDLPTDLDLDLVLNFSTFFRQKLVTAKEAFLIHPTLLFVIIHEGVYF